MKVIERIYEYLHSQGIQVNDFSKRVGASNGYFAKMKSSNANIGSHILEEIVSEYKDLNPDWLLTGSGSMLRGGGIQQVANGKKITQQVQHGSGTQQAALQQELTHMRDKLAHQQEKVAALERENQLLRDMVELLKQRGA